MVLPVTLLLLVERLQARGQTVVKSIHEGDGFLQRIVGSYGKQRSKELGAEREGTGLHIHLDGGTQDIMLLIDELRRNQPTLSGFEFEGLFQLLVLVGYHRPDDIAGIPYASHFERGSTVLELLEELGMVVNGTLHKQE